MKANRSKGKGGRPIVRHGAYSYMTRLSLPDHRAYLRPYLSTVREGLIHDLGPKEEDLTTAQKLIIDRCVGQVGVIRLIEEHCREEGILQGGIRGRLLAPILAKNYGAFVNSLRLNLQALGIAHKDLGDKDTDLETYLRDKRAVPVEAEDGDDSPGKE